MLDGDNQIDLGFEEPDEGFETATSALLRESVHTGEEEEELGGGGSVRG